MIQYSFSLPWRDEEDNRIYAYLGVEQEELLELPPVVRGIVYFNICLYYRSDTLTLDNLKQGLRKSASYLRIDYEEEDIAKAIIESIADASVYIETNQIQEKAD